VTFWEKIRVTRMMVRLVFAKKRKVDMGTEVRTRTLKEVATQTGTGKATLAGVVIGLGGIAYQVVTTKTITWQDAVAAWTLICTGYALLRSKQNKSGHTVPAE
jgi:hypothetical protein